MSQYIRVKREKTIIFLEHLRTDSVAVLKQKLGHIVRKDPRDIRLFFKNAPLEDVQIVENINLVNDSVVAMVYWIPGAESASDGKWEEIKVSDPDPLHDFEKELESDRKS